MSKLKEIINNQKRGLIFNTNSYEKICSILENKGIILGKY